MLYKSKESLNLNKLFLSIEILICTYIYIKFVFIYQRV